MLGTGRSTPPPQLLQLPYLTVLPVQDLEGLDVPRSDALGQDLALEVKLSEVGETPRGIWGAQREASSLAPPPGPPSLPLGRHQLPT